ncbi:MAG: chromate transporter [Oscillospiraceae bacterium]|nr:chromate transporter [Oscillospiraceae bacterium]
MILLKLFYTFFTIGLFTFGGGYAMLPLIQEKVIANGWMGMEELTNFVAISESTPGPFAINISTYVGAETAGVLGALCATLGVVLPSFIIILIVAKIYVRFKNSKAVSGVMFGLRAAVVGLMAAALWGMLRTVFFHGVPVAWENVLRPEFLCSAVIFAAAVTAALKKVSPILIIASSAAAGIAAGYLLGL